MVRFIQQSNANCPLFSMFVVDLPKLPNLTVICNTNIMIKFPFCLKLNKI